MSHISNLLRPQKSDYGTIIVEATRCDRRGECPISRTKDMVKAPHAASALKIANHASGKEGLT